MTRVRQILGAAGVASALALLCAKDARAQLPPPQRSDAWQTVSTVSMVVGMGSQLLMPRIYYADSEVTMGWKAR